MAKRPAAKRDFMQVARGIVECELLPKQIPASRQTEKNLVLKALGE